MTTLTAHDLTLGYGSRTIIHGVSLEVRSGEIVALVGPNGSGKSTLLRGLARLQKPLAGAVTLDGHDLRALPARTVARRLAILPQQPTAPGDLRVLELVWRGRHPHQGILQRASAADIQAVGEALHATNAFPLRERLMTELSGGEQQRAWIALALAQQPDVLLLDEPTASLDIAHQMEIMQLLQRMARNGMAITAVLHDLVLAARFATRIIAVRHGAILFDGPPDEVLQPAALAEAFGVRMTVLRDPETGAPVPLALASAPSLGSPDSIQPQDQTVST